MSRRKKQRTAKGGRRGPVQCVHHEVRPAKESPSFVACSTWATFSTVPLELGEVFTRVGARRRPTRLSRCGGTLLALLSFLKAKKDHSAQRVSARQRCLQAIPRQPMPGPGGSSRGSAVLCWSDTSPAPHRLTCILSTSPLPHPPHLCSNTLYFYPILPYQDSKLRPPFHMRPLLRRCVPMSPITSTHFWLYTSSPHHVMAPDARPVVPTQCRADARELESSRIRAPSLISTFPTP